MAVNRLLAACGRTPVALAQVCALCAPSVVFRGKVAEILDDGDDIWLQVEWR